MKPYSFLLACLLLANTSLLMGQSNDLSLLKAHKWKLVDYRSADATLICDDHMASLFNDNGTRYIILSIDADSVFTCQTYINDINGVFRLNKTDRSCSFKIRMMSAVGEPPWGKLFLRTLPLIKSLEVTQTDLKLNYDSGTRYMHFIK